MKKAIVVLLTLVILLVLVPTANTNPDNSSYDPMTDTNRDGVIDIYDLAGLGKAYGSSYTKVTQPNKTTITVLSYTSNFSYTPVANALVAVFPQGTRQEGEWKYTNLSGTVAFDQSANSSYIAIAWDDTRARFNYANYTTNSLGEASVTIWLEYWPAFSSHSDPIRMVPKGWIVVTILDNNTNEPYIHHRELVMLATTFTVSHEAPFAWTSGNWFLGSISTGISAIDSFKYNRDWGPSPVVSPSMSVCVDFYEPEGALGNCTYRTDEYGGAYAVATIFP